MQAIIVYGRRRAENKCENFRPLRPLVGVRPIQDYDSALKRILTRIGRIVVRSQTGADSIEWLDVELQRRGTLCCDLLGRMPGGGLVHIELQGSNDGRMWIHSGAGLK